METFDSFWLLEGSDPEMLLILCALLMPSIVGVLLALIALWLPEEMPHPSRTTIANWGFGRFRQLTAR
jgi:hypothetical protein